CRSLGAATFPRNEAPNPAEYLSERPEMSFSRRGIKEGQKQEKETMNKHNILKLALLLCAAACSIVTGTLLAFFGPEAPSNLSQRTLTFAERVAYQRAIEEVYWRHRIWPKERSDPKPSLDAVMSQVQLE